MALTVIPLPDLPATEAAARKLGPFLRARDVLALQGPPGAGKTTFARALLRALGIEEEVPSPTFTLVQLYETPHFSAYHFDLYRLENETDLVELGWDDALADELVIVEWPEHAPDSMPFDRLVLHFMMNDKGQRFLKLEPHGVWTERLGAF